MTRSHTPFCAFSHRNTQNSTRRLIAALYLSASTPHLSSSAGARPAACPSPQQHRSPARGAWPGAGLPMGLAGPEWRGPQAPPPYIWGCVICGLGTPVVHSALAHPRAVVLGGFRARGAGPAVLQLAGNPKPRGRGAGNARGLTSNGAPRPRPPLRLPAARGVRMRTPAHPRRICMPSKLKAVLIWYIPFGPVCAQIKGQRKVELNDIFSASRVPTACNINTIKS